MRLSLKKRSAVGLLAVSLVSGFSVLACSGDEEEPQADGLGGDHTKGGLSGLDSQNEVLLPELPAVSPSGETDPVKGFGDAADDPAIFVHPSDQSKSLILGTDKSVSGGLFVYNLDGSEREFLPLGELNNVDLRSGFVLGDKEVTLVTATNRTDDSLVILALDHESLQLSDVSKDKVETVFDSYGLCMYKSPSGEFYSFVNSTEGQVLQYHLKAAGEKVSAELVREFCVETQPEGCVVDDANRRLFLGEEAFGIWSFPAEEGAESTGSEMPACETAIAGKKIASTFDDELTRDVEGMALADLGDGNGYLIVSAQGAHEYVIYDRNPPHAHLFNFAIWGGGAQCIDGVEETDGLDVTTVALGDAYPNGLLVVQDGFNGDPVGKQNFKLVDLGEVLSLSENPDAWQQNQACNLGDYGGKARFADLPPGPERTEELCLTFCGKCAACYEEGDPGFSEGDCHYKSGKPLFLEDDCLEGCAAGLIPADTRPLTAGWESWSCLDMDDAL